MNKLTLLFFWLALIFACCYDGVQLSDSIEHYYPSLESENENELKNILTTVIPLMRILSPLPTWKRSNKNEPSSPIAKRDLLNLNNYYCCETYEYLLPLFAMFLLATCLLLIISWGVSTSTNGKRKRTVYYSPDIVVDQSTWLSMIYQMWKIDGAMADPYCAYRSLCEMNRMALASTANGWAVSFSSLPMSYLLHLRQGEHFVSYVNASLMGTTENNCSTFFLQCPRRS